MAKFSKLVAKGYREQATGAKAANKAIDEALAKMNLSEEDSEKVIEQLLNELESETISVDVRPSTFDYSTELNRIQKNLKLTSEKHEDTLDDKLEDLYFELASQGIDTSAIEELVRQRDEALKRAEEAEKKVQELEKKQSQTQTTETSTIKETEVSTDGKEETIVFEDKVLPVPTPRDDLSSLDWLLHDLKRRREEIQDGKDASRNSNSRWALQEEIDGLTSLIEKLYKMKRAMKYDPESKKGILSEFISYVNVKFQQLEEESELITLNSDDVDASSKSNGFDKHAKYIDTLKAINEKADEYVFSLSDGIIDEKKDKASEEALEKARKKQGITL